MSNHSPHWWHTAALCWSQTRKSQGRVLIDWTPITCPLPVLVQFLKREMSWWAGNHSFLCHWLCHLLVCFRHCDYVNWERQRKADTPTWSSTTDKVFIVFRHLTSEPRMKIPASWPPDSLITVFSVKWGQQTLTHLGSSCESEWITRETGAMVPVMD